MTIYAENSGAVQAIREEIGRLEDMLSGNNFDASDGVTMFFPNNAENRRAKLQALLDEIEGRAPPVVVEQEPTLETLHTLTHELMDKEPDTRDEEIAALRARVAELETPPPEPEPETHFADLMLADETIDDAKARLSQRLRELRHYLIAPEIKVNEDGSVGLTASEQSELQDLERRQTLGRWLEA